MARRFLEAAALRSRAWVVAAAVAAAATWPRCAAARRSTRGFVQAPETSPLGRSLFGRPPVPPPAQRRGLRVRGGFEEPATSRHDGVGYIREDDLLGHTEDEYDDDHDIIHHAGDLPDHLKAINLFMCETVEDKDPSEIAKQALAFDRFMQEYFRDHVLNPVDRFAEALNYMCEIEHLTHPEEEDGGVHALCDKLELKGNKTKALEILSDQQEAKKLFDSVKKEWAVWAEGKQAGVGKPSPALDPRDLGTIPRPPREIDLNPYIAQHLAKAKAEAAAHDAHLPAADATAMAQHPQEELPLPQRLEEQRQKKHRKHLRMARWGSRYSRSTSSVLKRWFQAGATAAAVFNSGTEIGKEEHEVQRVVDDLVRKNPAARSTHVLQDKYLYKHHIEPKIGLMMTDKYATGGTADGGLLLGPGIGYKSSPAVLASKLAVSEDIADTSIATVHLGDVTQHVASFHDFLDEAWVPNEVRFVAKSAVALAKQDYDTREHIGGAIVATDEMVTHGGHTEFTVVEDLLNLAAFSDTLVSAAGSLKAYVQAKAKFALLKGVATIPALSAAMTMVDEVGAEPMEAELVPETQVMMDLLKGSDAAVRLASIWSRLPKEVCSTVRHSLDDLNLYVHQVQDYLHHLS